MADVPIYTEIINRKCIVICTDDNDERKDDIFCIKLFDMYDNNDDDMWSFNKSCDFVYIIRAIVTKNWKLLGYCSEYIAGFQGDLLRNDIITKKEYDEIDEIRMENRMKNRK